MSPFLFVFGCFLRAVSQGYRDRILSLPPSLIQEYLDSHDFTYFVGY